MTTDIDMTVTAVKDNPATTEAVAEDRVTKRYIRLIDEMAQDLNLRHGWQSNVARQLGVDQSYVSRLYRRERDSVGLDSVELAIERLRIRPEYFHGRKEPASYKDYVGPDRGSVPYPAWAAFLRSELGQSMSADERDTLAAVRFQGGTPTLALYEGWLLLMRGALSRDELAIGVAATEAVDEEIRRRVRQTSPKAPGVVGYPATKKR
jgi:predicted XRE-type DNA-binding protein